MSGFDHQRRDERNLHRGVYYLLCEDPKLKLEGIANRIKITLDVVVHG